MSSLDSVPFLPELAHLLMNDNSFGSFTQINLVGSIIMMLFVAFYAIPYGKNYQKGKAYLKLEIPDRPAIIIVNICGPIIYILLKLYWPNATLFDIESLLYIAHYIHRGLVYPFFRSTSSKPWPLESFLYFLITNVCESILLARTQTFSGVNRPIYVKILLAILFIAAAVVAAIHDYKICALRTTGNTGYKIPSGLLFKWVSGPNYLFEIIQWAVYCFFLGGSLSTISFGLWLLVNISGRAEATHAWYTTFFKTKYPKDRTAYIPFVKNSRWFL